MSERNLNYESKNQNDKHEIVNTNILKFKIFWKDEISRFLRNLLTNTILLIL